jgi:hypothetical protein
MPPQVVGEGTGVVKFFNETAAEAATAEAIAAAEAATKAAFIAAAEIVPLVAYGFR